MTLSVYQANQCTSTDRQGATNMEQLTSEEIRDAVRENYGKVAVATTRGCGCAPTCCDPDAMADETSPDANTLSRALGYSDAELAAVPEGANLGLGCGNPQAIANLQAGETVLDIGSGAGFDAFLAARAVGDSGRVIGVDMTPDMLAKARANAQTAGFTNVEFR